MSVPSLGVCLIYVYSFGDRGLAEGRPELDKTGLSCDGCAEIWMDDIYWLIRPDSASVILVSSAFCNDRCDRIKIITVDTMGGTVELVIISL